MHPHATTERPTVQDPRRIDLNRATWMYDAYWHDALLGDAPTYDDADKLIDLCEALEAGRLACPACMQEVTA